MSRRRRRAGGESGARGARGEREAGATRSAAGRAEARAPGRAPYRVRPLGQVAILVAVFAVVTLIAELAGAANLGVALGVGQIAFGIALVVVLVKS